MTATLTPTHIFHLPLFYQNMNAIHSHFTLLICLIFTLQFSSFTAVAQTTQPICGVELEHDERMYTDPDYAAKIRSLDQFVARAISQERNNSSRTADTSVLTIPVVFHILHQNGPENIADSRIYQELANMNDAFRNAGFFDPSTGVDMHIEFCLASLDPNGLSTTGIERIQTPQTNISSGTENLLMKEDFNWDPKHYLNIYIVKSITFSNSPINGVATQPIVAGDDFDGVTIVSHIVGVPDKPAESQVMAHEIGHYFGLYHTFKGGCENDDCMLQGDRVCDTPPDDNTVTHEGCRNQNNCTTDANDPRSINPFTVDGFDMNTNYMDYNVGNCVNEFTAGQRERARAVIQNFRPGLLEGNVCRVPSPYDLAITGVTKPAAIICDSLFLPRVTLTNFGLVTVNSANIHVQVDQGPVQVVPWTGILPYGYFTAVPLPEMGISTGTHTLTFFATQTNGQSDGFTANDTMTYEIYRPATKIVPFNEGLEQGIPTDWGVFNPTGKTWERVPLGCDPSTGDRHCLVLGNDIFYASGYQDGLISPFLDLEYVTDPFLEFEVAYGYNPNIGSIGDRLSVQVSTDCGRTFRITSTDYNKQDSELSTKYVDSDTLSTWEPSDCGDWRTERVDLKAYEGQKILIRILGTKYYNGLPIYLNNIRVTGMNTTSISSATLQPDAISIYPNPAKEGFSILYKGQNSMPMQITVMDMMGREVWSKEAASVSSNWRHYVSFDGARRGIYLVQIKTETGTLSRKVVVEGR